jgi:hypothetical protein
MSLVKRYRLFPTSDVIESTNLAAVSPATVAATALVFAIGGSAMKLALVEESQSAWRQCTVRRVRLAGNLRM